MRRLFPVVLAGLIGLSACGTTPAATSAPTMPATSASATAANPAAQADLTSVKTYLLDNIAVLKASTDKLKTSSDRYYDLAKSANFDYAALWSSQQLAVTETIEQARAAWKEASPGYERVEGLVAGVPSLAEYDVILDAGASGSDGGDSVVPFDLTLPDGRVLPKPGNLFGVTESTLWGTDPAYVASGVQADFDGDGSVEFGETLPDANVLKSGVEALGRYVSDLQTAAQGWQPTESDAFTALVVMVPTMNEYFESWKNSRFVAGDASSQRDFVAISRLADIQEILSGLEVVYQGVTPMVSQVDQAQSAQIGHDLSALKAFVADVHGKEQQGEQFSAEDADMLGAEAQNRATAITGQISQVAAKLNVEIEE